MAIDLFVFLKNENKQSILKKAKNYIESNYQKDVSIEEISKNVGFSDLIIELINLMKNANKCEIKIARRRNFANRNNYFKDIFEDEHFASGYQVYEIDY